MVAMLVDAVSDRPDAVILAAGASRRMGANKLLLPLGTTTVLDCFLRPFPFALFGRVMLVYGDPRVAEAASSYPLVCVANQAPALGKSHSIRLGLARSRSPLGLMFCVADQPLLQAATVERLVKVFIDKPEMMVVPVAPGKAGLQQNPVVFPAASRMELEALQGDSGGRRLLARFPAQVRQVPFDDEQQFMDIDTPERYQLAREIYALRSQP
ncbi:NTP transferase domain-containing protein [Desulfogranum mediterraneum]|uniref:NTP transferase domain-containing protein n=1 Tax=Desulfogranum mediterraneum TaxID=160661 RepID=UPI000490C49C|nr:NTP transferase domain-containing protein [Desulfogranum mediterraneum]